MTTYNGEKFLKAQLDSILNQTFCNFELIVCDDCSKDNTRQILEEYKNKDKRIKLYFNEKNLGFKKNFEKAINLCQGTFIALSDQDDIWVPEHLELLYKNLGEADLICANCQLIDKNGNKLPETSRPKDIYIPENSDELFRTLLHINFVQGCVCLFKKEILPIFLPIPEEMTYHDYWLSLILSLNNKKIKYIPNIINFYRRHENNITADKKYSQTENIKNKINWFTYLLTCNPSSEKKQIIEEVILYHQALLNPKLRKKTAGYFLKYYKNIYQTKSSSKKALRFIKKYVFKR